MTAQTMAVHAKDDDSDRCTEELKATTLKRSEDIYASMSEYPGRS